MTFTPLLPAVSRLAARLLAALTRDEEDLRLTREDAEAVPGGRLFTRRAWTVDTKEDVDALAARWGTRAEWRAGNSQYVAVTGDCLSEREAVFYRDAPAGAGSGAAA